MWASFVRACLHMAILYRQLKIWHFSLLWEDSAFWVWNTENQTLHAHRHTVWAHKHTLGAADAAAEVVTSSLGRRVTNEPEHIVLALEMSRGVKMSPQIASGHQMSPLHYTPHLSLPPTLLLFPLFLICLLLLFFFLSSHPFSPSTAPFLSVLLCSPLILRHRFPFHLLKRADGGREQSKRIRVFLTLLLSSLPFLEGYPPLIFPYTTFCCCQSILSIHPYIYLSIHFLLVYVGHDHWWSSISIVSRHLQDAHNPTRHLALSSWMLFFPIKWTGT